MHRYGFRNASQQESLDASVAMRADYDQVRTPALRVIQDHLSGVADRQESSIDSFLPAFA